MAQSGFTPIQLYFSTTAAATPSAGNLANGELAVNITDGRLFYKDNGGTVRVLAGTGGSGVVAGSNTQVQFNNNGVFGASANMVFNGTRLTVADLADSGLTSGRVTYASTGGALVDSANLTFDGTNLTLGGGTANGVAYLNGSKVLTSGSALTFDGTNLANTLSANASAGIRVTNSNAGANTSTNTSYSNGTNSHEFGILGTGYTTYGVLAAGDAYIYAGASKNIALSADGGSIKFGAGAGGSEQMRLTSTGLGIGTSSPSTKLTVHAGADGDVGFFRGGSTRQVQIGTSSTAGYINTDNGSAGLELRTQGTARAYLDNSGNLGLGVTPSAWTSTRAIQLGASGSVYGDGQQLNWVAGVTMNAYGIQSGGSRVWRYVSGEPAYRYEMGNGAGGSVNGHAWYTAPSGTAGNAISFTQAMTLDASGNLLVGTTAASGNRLIINGVTRTMRQGDRTDLSFQTDNTVGAPAWPQRNLVGHYYTGSQDAVTLRVPSGGNANTGSYDILQDGTHIWYAAGGSTNSGSTAAERARIDSSGNLLVGVTSASARLQVAADTNAGAGNRVAIFVSTYSGGDSTYEALGLVKYANDTSGSQVFQRFFINQGNNGSGSIVANGANQATFGSYSDERLKENIVDLPPQLASILSLRPVEFDYKDGSGHQINFIAQEMREVYPDCVSEDKSPEKILSIAGWSKTEARLVKAIQEQQAIIESLKARLDAANL